MIRKKIFSIREAKQHIVYAVFLGGLVERDGPYTRTSASVRKGISIFSVKTTNIISLLIICFHSVKLNPPKHDAEKNDASLKNQSNWVPSFKRNTKPAPNENNFSSYSTNFAKETFNYLNDVHIFLYEKMLSETFF